MKTTVLLLATALCIMMSCSTEGPGPGGGTTFIPGFNATWPVEGDDNREIDIQPDSLNRKVHSGVFPGEEILDGGSTSHPLSGSFNGLNIEFTINRGSAGSVKYTGTMTPVSETDHTIIRIDLHSSEGNMALVSQ